MSHALVLFGVPFCNTIVDTSFVEQSILVLNAWQHNS